jgi:hypothetical protein
VIPYQGKLLGLTPKAHFKSVELAGGESNEKRNRNKNCRRLSEPSCKGESDSSDRHMGRHTYFGAHQCDISTGTVIDRKMLRVTPPRMNSRKREWP